MPGCGKQRSGFDLGALGILDRPAEFLDQGVGDRVAAVAGQNPDKPRLTVPLDDHGGDIGADVDDRLGHPRIGLPRIGPARIAGHRLGRTDQRERSKIQLDRHQPGSADRRHEGGHHVAGGDHEQDLDHSLRTLAVPGRGVIFRQDVVVEVGLLDRHRDVVGHLELQGFGELRRDQPVQFQLANHHAVVGDTEDHLLAAELVLGPQRLERRSEGLGVADLPGLDDAPRQRVHGDLLHFGGALAPGELDGAQVGTTDVQRDEGPSHHSPMFAIGRGLPRPSPESSARREQW